MEHTVDHDHYQSLLNKVALHANNNCVPTLAEELCQRVDCMSYVFLVGFRISLNNFVNSVFYPCWEYIMLQPTLCTRTDVLTNNPVTENRRVKDILCEEKQTR